jgi:hypothetical protein
MIRRSNHAYCMGVYFMIFDDAKAMQAAVFFAIGSPKIQAGSIPGI